jgi:2-aminoadipate transaminase
MTDVATIHPPLPLSTKARRTKEQPISFLINAVMANPKLINLAAGLVDAQTLPVEATRDSAAAILGDDARARAALQYGTTLGLTELRKLVLEHIESLEGKSAAEMGFTSHDIILTTGSQQALYLLGEVLIDPGDIVIAANPSYFVYTGTLSSFGANVMTVPMDDQGMDVDAVEKLLARLEREGRLDRVKMVYCTSFFDNPTGLTLSRERRPRLLEIVKGYSRSHRIMILEDAAYRELRYDGDALPSIKSFDSENAYTAIANTFSKPFAPGIKTGYTVMPHELMHEVLQQKGNHDFGSANLCQHIVLDAMRRGAYATQGDVLRAAYRAKRDAVLAALHRYMPKHPGISWTRPAGGFYVWLTLPESIDTSRESHMFNQCVSRGVLYVPGDYCFQPDERGFVPTNHLRISYGQVPPEQIAPGIEKLASVIAEVLPR